jgi:hypothetical protein
MYRSRRGFVGFRLAAFVFVVFLILPCARSVQATTIDIMLVYDTTATSWVASNGGMAAFSLDVVNRMNQAMQNSGVDITFRLVHSMSVAYTTKATTGTLFVSDLESLQEADGPFAQVAAARNTYGADVIAMLIDHGSAYGYVGIGYMLMNWSGEADYAYTVNAIRAVEVSHTLTHEVGHNLGADHSKYQTADPGPNDYLDGQYSAGWYFTGMNGIKYHTIMAYNDDGRGNFYTEAPLFSSPLRTYQGTMVGHVSHGDNARLLGQTGKVVAAYRASNLIDQKFPPVPAIDCPEIAAVYVAFFERAPNYAGLKYWADQAGAGGVDFSLMRRLTNGFAQHPSYTAIYGGLSDSAFVDAIYLNIGGAPADADGKAYWLAQLVGGMTRPDFIAQFILDLLSYSEDALDQLVRDGVMTVEERANALLRKNRLTNKAVVGLAFANTLGSASNLSPETDPNDPDSLANDPAYRASVKIIADVTEEMATRVAALAYLDTQPSIEDINNR